MSNCPYCGANGTTSDRFCGRCGKALPNPGVQAQSGTPQRSWRGWMIGAVVAVVVLASAGAWIWAVGVNEATATGAPFDVSVVEAHVRRQLPPHVELTTFRAVQNEQQGQGESVAVTTAVRAEVRAKVDTFVPDRNEGEVLLLSPRLAGGGYEILTGTARSKRVGDEWRVELTPDGDWSSHLGMPRSAFAEAQTIVANSPEEQAFRTEQAQAAERDRQLQQATDAEAARRNARLEEERRRVAALESERQRLAIESQRLLDDQEKLRLASEQRKLEIAAVREVPSPAPASVPIELESGSLFNIRLRSPLNSGTATVEDRFEAVTAAPVALTGGGTIPEGAVVRGIVAAVEPATRTNRTARLTLSVDLLTINGRSYPVRGSIPVITGSGLKGETKKVAIGTAVGAVLGGIFGGAKGAVLGGAAGGGGTVAATEGKEIDLPPGTVLQVTIETPVRIQ